MNDSFDCQTTPTPVPVLGGNDDPGASRSELALRLRTCLSDTVVRLASGTVDIRHPDVPGGLMPRGSGHFHLAAELFIQVAGWTVFQFPQGEQRLAAGDILLIPPRLLHKERVGADGNGQGFENLVVFAEDGAFRCHLAQEISPGVPGILYLEMGRHAQEARIQDWLSAATPAIGDKARTATGSLDSGITGETGAGAWSGIQSRALVTAALTGVLAALDDRQKDRSPEPMLVSRVRVMVQNQLGDRTLTVRGLAAQTGYTADYLSNFFSVATGEHLSAYINRLRVERAAHLLRQSTLASKEIAWACGFSSPSYFIRAFRAHFGQAPKAWRSAKP